MLPGKMSFCLALLSVTFATAATPDFLLGVDYSTSLGLNVNSLRLKTDGSGAVYAISPCSNAEASIFCVVKLSPGGQLVWQQETPGFEPFFLAVDVAGNVYAAVSDASGTDFVERLSGDGQSVLWRTPVGPGLFPADAAIDSAGNLYLVGATTQGGFIERLSAAGTIDQSASLPFPVFTVTVDGLGRPFITYQAGLLSGRGWSTYVERLDPDSLQPSWSVEYGWTFNYNRPPAVAADRNGNVWVYGGDANGHAQLLRYDAQGDQTLSKTMSSEVPGASQLAVDAAGNAYITGFTLGTLLPMKNSLATCGTSYLSVFAPGGSLLQSAYLPGAGNVEFEAIGVASNSTVFLVGPLLTSQGIVLMRLSQRATTRTFPLACMGNAATYGTGSIAPGEIVTLFGNGLGPQQGIQTSATLHSPFPAQIANVKVTFDGTPAPLLWVQDAQINAVVPWSLTPGQTTHVCVSYNAVETNCLAWPVAQTAEGLFMVDGTYAAALNEDGTINSAANPAKTGSVVTVFATGMGPISPAQVDGSLVTPPLPVNQLPVQASYTAYCQYVGASITDCYTAPLAVEYAGPAPFEVAGLTQINFHAPPVVEPISSSVGAIAVNEMSFRIYLTAQ
jgi:uncharacterized protein (TIGR03437 family)